MVAYNLNSSRGPIGSQLLKTNFTPPSTVGNVTISLTSVYLKYNTLVFQDTSHLRWYDYSIVAGSLVWTSPIDEQFAYYGTGTNIYNGIFYTLGYG